MSGKADAIDFCIAFVVQYLADVDRLHFIRIPNHHELVVAPGGDQLAIGREVGAVDGPIVAGEGRKLPVYRAIRCRLFAIDNSRTLAESGEPGSHGRPLFPNDRFAVLSGCDNPISVRREIRGPDPPTMFIEHLDRHTSAKVPQAGRVVVGTTQELPVIRRETHRQHAIGVPLQWCANHATCSRIEDLNCLVAAAAGNLLAIVRVIDRENIRAMRHLVADRAGLCVAHRHFSV